MDKHWAANDGLGWFFGLTFGVSWLLAWIPAVLTGQSISEFPAALLWFVGGFAPSVTAIVLVHRLLGADQRRDFWRRVVDFRRISPLWYALIFLTLPLVILISLGINALLGGEAPGMANLRLLQQQPLMIVPVLLIALTLGALSEELGWRGFAQERMIRRWGPAAAIGLLAVMWGAWHLPLFLLPGTSQHAWGWGSGFFWLFLAQILPLTVWIGLAYQRNGGSTLAAVLIHFIFNLIFSLVFPISLTLFAIQVVVLYLVVGAIAYFELRFFNTAAQH
jgi:uncharacterized protein